MHDPQNTMNLLMDNIGDILKRFKQLKFVPKEIINGVIIERFFGVAIPAGAEMLKFF